MKLKKPKRGRSRVYDFGKLKVGDVIALPVPNPWSYVYYWNRTNKSQVEVVKDNEGNAFARRVK